MPRVILDTFEPDSTWLSNARWKYLGPGIPVIALDDGALSFAPQVSQGNHFVGRCSPFLDGDFIVRGFQRSTATGTSRFRWGLRSNGRYTSTAGTYESAHQGVFVSLDNTGGFSVIKYVNNTATTIGTLIAGKAPGTTAYDIRLRVTGNNVQARVWPSANAEPGTWDFDLTNVVSDVPAGVPHMAFFRAASAATLAATALEVTSPALVIGEGPLIFYDSSGKRMPYGKVKGEYVDDAMLATPPAWITGTTSHVSATFTRRLEASGSNSASITLPVIPAGEAEAILLKLQASRLNVDTNIVPHLQLVGASTYELVHAAGEATAKLVAGALSQATQMQWRGNAEGPRRRNLGLLLLPRLGQLIALLEDQVIGWIELGAAVTGNITPTVKVDATTAAAAAVNWGQLALAVERY